MDRKLIYGTIVFLGILIVGYLSITGNAVWSGEGCSRSDKCPAGMGDCDKDSDCVTAYCAHNIGEKYGQHWEMDICECPAGTEWDGSACQIPLP